MKKITSYIYKYIEMIVTIIVVWLAAVCLLSTSLPQLLNTNIITNGPISKLFIALTFAVLLVTLRWIINRTIKNKRWKNNLFNIVWILHAIAILSIYLIRTFYGVEVEVITLKIVTCVFSCIESVTMLLKLFTIINNRKQKNENAELFIDNNQGTVSVKNDPNQSGDGSMIDSDKH